MHSPDTTALSTVAHLRCPDERFWTARQRWPAGLQDFLPLLLPAEVRVKAFEPGDYLMFQDDPGAADYMGNEIWRCMLSKESWMRQVPCMFTTARRLWHCGTLHCRIDRCVCCAADCAMFILEGQAEVLLWVPRAAGEDTGDAVPAVWSDDSLAPEALHSISSQVPHSHTTDAHCAEHHCDEQRSGLRLILSM